MTDKIDVELNDLLNKLNKIQAEIGGAKAKIKSYDGDGKVDRFLDLKDQMTERLVNLKENFELIQDLEKQPGSNQRDLIVAQSKVRTDLAGLNEEWQEMYQVFQKEAKKKRSKMSPEDLAQREQVLKSLQIEIQRIKDIQRAGLVKEYQGKELDTLEESELFNPRNKAAAGGGGDGSSGDNLPRPRGVVGKRNNNMTDEDRVKLQLLKERDTQIDHEIELIGKAVDELADIARTANEEVKLQNKMLDRLETKVDDVHEHLTNVNVKLKNTLEEARKSDKICCDILCLLLLIGMIAVVVELSKQKQAQGK